jgi:excisionase family DNA binding protein
MITTAPERLLLTVPEAAERLAISRSKLYELLAAGEIPTVHIGRSVRVPAAGLARWVEGMQQRQSYDSLN